MPASSGPYILSILSESLSRRRHSFSFNLLSGFPGVLFSFRMTALYISKSMPLIISYCARSKFPGFLAREKSIPFPSTVILLPMGGREARSSTASSSFIITLCFSLDPLPENPAFSIIRYVLDFFWYLSQTVPYNGMLLPETEESEKGSGILK